MIDWVRERQIPGDFAMDSYFTCAEILNHIHGKQDHFGQPRGYVGDLKTNRKLDAPTLERCPRQEPLGRNWPPAFALCHKVGGPFRDPSALPSQWTQGREMH